MNGRPKGGGIHLVLQPIVYGLRSLHRLSDPGVYLFIETVGCRPEADQKQPFDSAQGREARSEVTANGEPERTTNDQPFDLAQGRPFDLAQGRQLSPSTALRAGNATTVSFG